jgi:hypothetical protein
MKNVILFTWQLWLSFGTLVLVYWSILLPLSMVLYKARRERLEVIDWRLSSQEENLRIHQRDMCRILTLLTLFGFWVASGWQSVLTAETIDRGSGLHNLLMLYGCLSGLGGGVVYVIVLPGSLIFLFND